MRYRTRIKYTSAQRAEIWDRWQRGESMSSIGRVFDRESSSIFGLLSPSGGIRPTERKRSAIALTLSEREEISRGIVGGLSMRTMALQLGRAVSTISREIARNGGIRVYRASCADQAAWDRCTLKEYWNFKFQYDFVGTGKKKALDDGLKDAYIAYTGFKLLKITVGHFKEPFSLEELTSSNYYTFMERALPNTLSLGRNLGVRFDTYGDLWTASAGVFGGGLEQPTHGGHGVTGRMTFSPIHKKDEVIHLGVAGSWRSSNDDDSIRFRAQPESYITDVRLVDTGTFDAKDFFRLGIEAAAVKGPFAIQTEYLRVDANRKISSNADIDFDGYYIEGSWFLTGESRNYNFNGGNFKGVRPNNAISSNGPGAWQLAARFSHIDLSDNDVMGGEQDNVSVGINWYPTTNIRFIANYIKVLEVDGGTLDGNEPSVFQMRAQIYW